MPSYSDFVRDDYTRPIPGALVQLFAIDGTTLIDTDMTGADGQFTVTGPDAKYMLQVSYGGASERSTVIVGNPPEYVGPTGAAAAFRASLEIFKAASILDGQSTYDGSIWYWTPGDFTGQADDINTVEADSTPLSEGAWVRQKQENQTRGIKSYGARGNLVVDDTAAVARGITATGGTAFLIGGNLPIPRGQYATAGGTLNTSQFWRLHGDGYLSSFFVNTGAETESLFTSPGSYGFADYDNFGARGYKSFLDSAGNVEQIFSRSLHVFNGKGYAFDLKGFLITGQFDGLHVDGQNNPGSGGFKVAGSFNNLQFNTPQFNNLQMPAFDLQFSEGVVTTNMRVEGGDAPAKSVMKLANGTHQHLTHIGAYIEGSFEFIISADGTGAVPYNGPGVLSFIGTHFTFWRTGVPHKWAITSPFVMLANDFTIATRVPPTAQVLGFNQNLERAEYVSHTPFVSKKRRPATVAGTGPWVQDVFVLRRPDPALQNTPMNSVAWSGQFIYTASWSNPDGGAAGATARKFDVTALAVGGGNVVMTFAAGPVMDTGNAAAVLTTAVSGSSSTTQAVCINTWTGVNPASIANFDQQWSITWTQSAGIPENTFAISEPGA